MALGSSFGVTPAGLEEQAQRAKKRMPTQQALQTLSLALPKTLGSNTTAPSAMMSGAYRPGGVPDSADAQMSRMVRAMTGGQKAGSARPVRPPRFTQTQSSRAPTPVPSPKPPVAAAPTGPQKPDFAMFKKPGAGKFRDEDLPSMGGYERPEPGDPGYIDPSKIGGGLVDQIVSPPKVPVVPPSPQGPTGPPPGVGAPPQYGGNGTPYNDANGGGSGGFVWDAQRGMWSQPGFTRGA
jgi:hypothetical protein